MTKLLIFRHGETDWNTENRFQGHIDVPLNDNGRTQAIELGQRLRSCGIEALLTSDLQRSEETARLVALEIGLSPDRIFKHAGIRESHLGQAQGLTTEEIRKKFGEKLMARWRSNLTEDADVSYPGGETGTQVLVRATHTIAQFILDHPHLSTLGVATHGGVIRRLVYWITGKHAAIPNGSVHEIHFDAQQWPSAGSWRAPKA